jgi:hypothetical protein
MSLKRPGLLFKAEPMSTVFSHIYGSSYETYPHRNELYVVCKDGSIQSRHDPERYIAWELIENEKEGWSYGHNKPLLVFFVGWDTDIPDGRGSDLTSTNACIVEGESEGEDEVTSA